MDKLKMAFRLVAKQAKKKRRDGAVPAFLGARGLLALMYDRIVAFSVTATNTDEEQMNYLIDLAVNSVYAVASVLPEIDDISLDEEELEDTEDSVTLTEEPQENESSDPRWTKVEPGQPLPQAKDQDGTD